MGQPPVQPTGSRGRAIIIIMGTQIVDLEGETADGGTEILVTL